MEVNPTVTEQLIFNFNGIDGESGSYGLEPMTGEELARHIRGSSRDDSREREKLERQLLQNSAKKIIEIVRFLTKCNFEDVARDAAWEDNWGFVPVSDAEFDWLAKELKPVVLPELVRFAFMDDEPVGVLLCVPDWNPVMGDLDGSPWRHPLRTLKHVLRSRAENMEGLRLILLGVKPGFRDRGIEGVLLGEGLRVSIDTGYQWCEYSWILEDNELTKRAVRLMGGEVYKVYRVYEKAL